MQTVYDAANVIDAHLVRQALEAEGIPAYVRGESLAGAIGELGVFGLVAVMVPVAAWPAARDLVEAMGLAGRPDAPAVDDPGGEAACPA